jgi:hypothetical protein
MRSQQTFTSVVHDMHSGEFQKSTVDELRSVGCAGAVPSSGSVWVNKHALTADHWRRRRVYRHKTLALPYERAAQFVKPPSAYVRGGKGEKGRAAESEIARVTPWLERELQALLEERCVHARCPRSLSRSRGDRDVSLVYQLVLSLLKRFPLEHPEWKSSLQVRAACVVPG